MVAEKMIATMGTGATVEATTEPRARAGRRRFSS